MVRVGQDYAFDGPHGPVTLAGLFDDRRQLIIQHVMFGPDWDTACPGCTAAVDEVSAAMLAHLRSRDTAFALVSRAPLVMLTEYAAARGWTVPWYSSDGSDFNYELRRDAGRGAPAVQLPAVPDIGADGGSAELPGLSCFLRDDGQVFRTYSTYARGTDQLGSVYTLLDLTALGRQEDWEEPRGRAPRLHGADPTFAD